MIEPMIEEMPAIQNSSQHWFISQKSGYSLESLCSWLIRWGYSQESIDLALSQTGNQNSDQERTITDMLFESIAKANGTNIDEQIFEWTPALTDSNGSNLFQFLIEKGCLNGVEKLGQRFQNDPLVMRKDKEGKNPLHLAAIQGDEAIIRYIIKNNFCAIEGKDTHGLIPLHWAIMGGHAAAVRTLIKEGSLLSPFYRADGATLSVLAMAIVNGNPEILECLLQNDFMHELSLDCHLHNAGTLLHLAILYNQSSILQHIIQVRHAETQRLLNQQDGFGRTPLQLASSLGDLCAIRLLYDQGVDLNYGEDQKEGTALHYAASGEHEQAIQLLVYLGAKITPLNANLNTPASLIADRDSLSAIKCYNLLTRLQHQGKVGATQPPDYRARPPENFVFRGGGAKGIAFLGAIQEMEQLGTFTEMRRLAGTSAGAIISCLLACGYRSKDLEQHLSYDFSKFFDYKDTFEKDAAEAVKKQSFLQSFSALWKEYWGGWQTLLNPLQRAMQVKEKLSKFEGFCQGEEFRKWMEELIYQATNIHYCTFKELRTCAKKNPEKYKELHIFATKMSDNAQEICRFDTNNPEWDDLIISDAIRASMSIPGVFEPHTLHFKGALGVRYPRGDYGRFLDGGILRNFPLDAFDEEKYQENKNNVGIKTNRRTLGLTLCNDAPISVNADSNASSLISLMKSLFFIYWNAEDTLSKEKSDQQYRTIAIPIHGVNTTDFDLSFETKAELKEAGKQAVSRFFETKATL